MTLVARAADPLGVRGVCPKTGKRAYTRKAAKREALRWRITRFARMNHFRCRSCGCWHIGNFRRKPRRR